MAFTTPAPAPPPPHIKRYNPDGSPTQAQINFETKLLIWLRSLAAQVGAVVTQAAVTVANLPDAATASIGATAFVTDATVTLSAGIGTTVAGSGTNKVPVYCNGTNWLIG